MSGVLGVVAGALVIAIRSCLEDSNVFVFVFGGSSMVMVSGIIFISMGIIAFITAIACLGTWCCRCCGAPPLSDPTDAEAVLL
jgi:hypothetical protein